MNEQVLSQNAAPNFRLKFLLAMKNCIAQVANCTHKLVKAAPCALNAGMNIKFSVRFVTTPIAATILSCLRLPLAVSNVPNMYVIEIDMKLPISICNILDDSDMRVLWISSASLPVAG